MADIQKIHALQVPVEVAIQGIKIKFKVSPSQASDTAFQAELNRLSAEVKESIVPGELRTDHRDYEYALANVVTVWDLTDEGNPLPITEESVKLLPDVLKVAMWNAATEAMAPKNLIRRTPPTTSQRGG